jgi:acyl-CoA thioesterase-2
MTDEPGSEDEEYLPSVERLLALLDLERLDRDLYRAAPTASATAMGGGRLFGGQVAAQALRAATSTIDVDHHVHSLHGYFLRPGRFELPLLLQVDRIRGGTSFTTRRVNAIQEGEAIFSLACSFHKQEEGQTYAPTMPPGIPDPDDEDHPWEQTMFAGFASRSPFEMRELPMVGPDEHGRYESTRRVWMRTRGALPDDPAVQACVTTFFSDMGAVFAAARIMGMGGPGTGMGASLDHAVWFHRPLRFDDWVLYDLAPLSTGGARGLVLGAMYDRAGVLCASMTQEALVRPFR